MDVQVRQVPTNDAAAARTILLGMSAESREDRCLTRRRAEQPAEGDGPEKRGETRPRKGQINNASLRRSLHTRATTRARARARLERFEYRRVQSRVNISAKTAISIKRGIPRRLAPPPRRV